MHHELRDGEANGTAKELKGSKGSEAIVESGDMKEPMREGKCRSRDKEREGTARNAPT